MAVVVRWKLILATGAMAAADPDKSAFVLRNTPERGEPFDHSPLKVNPPTFRWPPAKSAASYEIQLARSKDLRDPVTATVRETFHRPREPLAPGRWLWRYTGPGGRPGLARGRRRRPADRGNAPTTTPARTC